MKPAAAETVGKHSKGKKKKKKTLSQIEADLTYINNT